MDLRTIGERIRYLREINQYTREAFAEKVNISSKFLYEIETGQKNFSIRTLYKLASVLSVSCDYILTGNNHENKYFNQANDALELFDVEQRAKVRDVLLLIYDITIT